MGWERRGKLHCMRRRGEGWEGIGLEIDCMLPSYNDLAYRTGLDYF